MNHGSIMCSLGLKVPVYYYKMHTSTSSCLEMSHLINNALSPDPVLFIDFSSSMPSSSVKQMSLVLRNTDSSRCEQRMSSSDCASAQSDYHLFICPLGTIVCLVSLSEAPSLKQVECLTEHRDIFNRYTSSSLFLKI